MLNNWIFKLAILEMAFAITLYLIVFKKQLVTLKTKGALTPYKRMLIGSVAFMIIGTLPLMFVYINIVWFHWNANWIIYMAVVSNATTKIIIGVLLNMIYNFKVQEALK